MTKRHRIIALAFIAVVIAVIWLAPNPAPVPRTHFGMGNQQEVGFSKGTVTLPAETLPVDIALGAASWKHGMMFRKDWGDIKGMLFVFPNETVRNFWMKNTYLPLDIVYINAGGKIVHIAENAVPLSTENISSVEPAQYVLEIPAGAAKTYDLKPGDTISWSME